LVVVSNASPLITLSKLGRLPTIQKEQTTKKTGTVIIANAIIWAAVLIASAIVLQGTGYMGRMIPILGGGAIAMFIILAGILRRQ